MSAFQDIPYKGVFQELSVGAADYREADTAVLRHMFFHILLIREIELVLLGLKDQDQVHGPVHSSIGQEGAAVGAMQILRKEDRIASTHRGHHHFLAKMYNAYAGNIYDPLQSIPDSVYEVTEKTMAEILGLASGYCRGRGGSMHLGDREGGCIGTNAIVAGGVASAVGTAWASRMDGGDRISVSFLGDGAVNQGVVHEVMNMAALWKIPVVFFVENNLYAVATHVNSSASVEHLAQRGLAYGITSWIVDGMDPVAVMKAMELAKDHALKEGPVLIEALTYRFRHQSQSLPGSAYGYRTKKEESEWEKRDPKTRFAEVLVELGVMNPEERTRLESTAVDIVNRALDTLTVRVSPGTAEDRKVREELFPDGSDLHLGARSDGTELSGLEYRELTDFPEINDKKLVAVIPEVISRRMEKDDGVVVLGEEVANMRGGVFQATRGLHKLYPDRIISTPISESGFTGMALGLALSGKRPVVEIMYPDFTLVAADQVFNQIGKCRYMYGNQYDLPIVFRTRVSLGTGYGAQHSMEPAALYGQFPGWRIVAPATPFDYIGLFNTAVASNDPVLVIEHQGLYEEAGPVPEDRDYCIPFGKAAVRRTGDDITLVAYSYMTIKAQKAAAVLEKEGVSAEVIDLRTVDYPGVDYGTIGASVAKTGRTLVLEEGPLIGGLGAQIGWEVQKRFFDELDCEVERAASESIPVPVSRAQEERTVLQIDDIVRRVRELMS